MDKIKEKYCVRVKKDYEIKKSLFEKSKQKLSVSDAAFNQEIEKTPKIVQLLLKDMESIKKSLIELDKIALNPRIFTNEILFTDVIEYAKEEKKPEWEFRVKVYKIMQEKAKQINILSNDKDLTLLFPQFNEKNILLEYISK